MRGYRKAKLVLLLQSKKVSVRQAWDFSVGRSNGRVSNLLHVLNQTNSLPLTMGSPPPLTHTQSSWRGVQCCSLWGFVQSCSSKFVFSIQQKEESRKRIRRQRGRVSRVQTTFLLPDALSYITTRTKLPSKTAEQRGDAE